MYEKDNEENIKLFIEKALSGSYEDDMNDYRANEQREELNFKFTIRRVKKEK